MSILDKIGSLLGGGDGLVGKIADAFTQVKQGKIDLEKAQLLVQDAMAERAHQITMAVIDNEREAERQFNERTTQLEGTAGDLKSVPYVGAVVLFLRGAYRPLFAYFNAYLLFRYFVQGMDWTEKQESLLYAVTLLVLVFFFGERAVKNVAPLISQVFAAKTK